MRTIYKPTNRTCGWHPIASITLSFVLGFGLGSCGEPQTEDDGMVRESDKDDYEDMMEIYNRDREESGPKDYVEIPSCRSHKEEKLIYVPQEEAFIVCRDGIWQYLVWESGEACPITEPVDEEEPIVEEADEEEPTDEEEQTKDDKAIKEDE